jgi:hypothetical protein
MFRDNVIKVSWEKKFKIEHRNLPFDNDFKIKKFQLISISTFEN